MSSVNWKPFVFGGLASVTAECGKSREVRPTGGGGGSGENGVRTFRLSSHSTGTFPIDLAKTRLQVQGQVADSKFREIRYRGMLHAIVRIAREEGVRALYSGSVRGINATMCCSFPVVLSAANANVLSTYVHVIPDKLRNSFANYCENIRIFALYLSTSGLGRPLFRSSAFF